MARFIQAIPVLANANTLEQVMTSDGQLVVTLDGQVVTILSGLNAQLVWTDISIPNMRVSPIQYVIYRGDGSPAPFFYPIAVVNGQTFTDLYPKVGTSQYYVVPLYERTVLGIPSNIVTITVSLT